MKFLVPLFIVVALSIGSMFVYQQKQEEIDAQLASMGLSFGSEEKQVVEGSGTLLSFEESCKTGVGKCQAVVDDYVVELDYIDRDESEVLGTVTVTEADFGKRVKFRGISTFGRQVTIVGDKSYYLSLE